MRYLLYTESEGYFIGEMMGMGFWTNMDRAGQTHCVTFPNPRVAKQYSKSWTTPLEGLEVKEIETEEEYISFEKLGVLG